MKNGLCSTQKTLDPAWGQISMISNKILVFLYLETRKHRINVSF